MVGSGYEKLMPEGRSWPWKYFPRRGIPLSITFGEPIPADKIRSSLWATPIGPPTGVATTAKESELTIGDPVEEERSLAKTECHWLSDVLQHRFNTPEGVSKQKRIAFLRSEITAVLQREVETLGRTVLGRKA